MAIELSIDWFTCSFSSQSFPAEMIPNNPDELQPKVLEFMERRLAEYTVTEILGMSLDLFDEYPRGLNWVYQRSLRYENITVDYYPYENASNTGVVVNMSGKGCDAWEAGTSWASWRDFLGFCRSGPPSQGFNCTRIDLAADDKVPLDSDEKPLLDIEVIGNAVNSRFYRSRVDSHTVVFEGKLGRSKPALTCYLGSQKRDNNGFSRIYDKAAEQNCSDEFHWVRVERVCKRNWANPAVNAIIDSDRIGDAFRGIISGHFDFVDETPSDINRSRWPLSSWWETFLDFVSMEETLVKLPQRAPTSIVKLASWVHKQVASALTVLSSTIGFDSLKKLCRNFDENTLPPKYRELIKRWRFMSDDERCSVTDFLLGGDLPCSLAGLS